MCRCCPQHSEHPHWGCRPPGPARRPRVPQGARHRGHSSHRLTVEGSQDDGGEKGRLGVALVEHVHTVGLGREVSEAEETRSHPVEDSRARHPAGCSGRSPRSSQPHPRQTQRVRVAGSPPLPPPHSRSTGRATPPGLGTTRCQCRRLGRTGLGSCSRTGTR